MTQFFPFPSQHIIIACTGGNGVAVDCQHVMVSLSDSDFESEHFDNPTLQSFYRSIRVERTVNTGKEET